MVKLMALSLALAAAALVVPQLATPAHAGLVTSFQAGDVVKIKTNWGGGYVLNLGGDPGSTVPGLQARVHYNIGWDNPNRFKVLGPEPRLGLMWVLLMNQWSNLCLSAKPAANLTLVTQEVCNPYDDTQLWSSRAFTVWDVRQVEIRNLAHYEANLNTVLSQKILETVGSPIWMETKVNDFSRQVWQIHTCLLNGVEQKYC
jgi:hypothetical protein